MQTLIVRSSIWHKCFFFFFFPFKLQPHQQVFTFIGLQVLLASPQRRIGLNIYHNRNIMKEVCLLLQGFVNLLRSTIYYFIYFHMPTIIYTGEKMKDLFPSIEVFFPLHFPSCSHGQWVISALSLSSTSNFQVSEFLPCWLNAFHWISLLLSHC